MIFDQKKIKIECNTVMSKLKQESLLFIFYVYTHTLIHYHHTHTHINNLETFVSFWKSQVDNQYSGYLCIFQTKVFMTNDLSPFVY